MMRAGALRRLTAGLFLAAAVAVGTSACVLAPVPPPYGGAVIAPAPVIVAPRPHYHYYGGGYYRGGYHRGGGHRHWR